VRSKQQFGGDWTSEKLNKLSKYLSTYTTILSKKLQFKYAYIDAFAGTGYREIKANNYKTFFLFPELSDPESQRFLQGSARIALECKPPFSKYIFVEKNVEKLAELQNNLIREYPEKENDIIFYGGDANTVIQEVCEKNWCRHRAVLFLDPFGMQVEWPTIQAVAKTKAIDLWILFPLGVAVNRMLTKNGQINETWKQKLNQIFGTDDWYDVFYKMTPNLSLFDEEATIIQKIAGFSDIMTYYVKRLQTVFPYVAENPLPLFNSKNNPLFALFFAANKPNAVKIAQDILRN
jgi:three-Cys-motif partner protein